MLRDTPRTSRRTLSVQHAAPVYWLLLAAYGLRLFRLDHQSFWWDEMWTSAVAALPIQAILEEAITDRVHPPLYALLTHVWAFIGRTEFVLRYFSLLSALLAVPLLYAMGRRTAGHRVGLTAAFLLTLSPFHIWYSQEARMYAFLTTAVLAACWFLLHALDSGSTKAWLGYAISLLLALYTHYITLFVVLAQYTFFSLHYRRLKGPARRWLLVAGLCGLGFAFWGAAIMATGGLTQASISWIPPARWFDPLLTMLTLAAGSTIDLAEPYAYITLLLLAVGLSGWRRPAPDQILEADLNPLLPRFFLAWLLIPLLLTFLISLDLPLEQKRSMYMDRYFIVLLPPLFLLLSWGLGHLAGRRTSLIWLFLFAWTLLSGRTINNMYFDTQYARTNWRAAIDQVKAEWQPNDVLWIPDSQILPVLFYAYDELPYKVLPDSMKGSSLENDPALTADHALATLADGAKRIWIFSAYANVNTHGFPQDRSTELEMRDDGDSALRWLDAHFDPVSEWTFTGIRLSVYDAEAPR